MKSKKTPLDILTFTENYNFRRMFFFLLVVVSIFFLTQSSCYAEDYWDSKGKDFWLTFIPNYHNNKLSSDPTLKYGDSLYIFITCDKPTSGMIEYKDSSGQVYYHPFVITNPQDVYVFKTTYFNYELVGYNDQSTAWSRNQCERIAPQSFHITAQDEVTVYALSQAVMTSDAFLCLPTDVLGTDYFVSAYKSDGVSTTTNSARTPSQFAIVATEDGTEVKIIPSTATYYYGVQEQNIVLNKGDVYLVQARISNDNKESDLTGSHVHSNKPIAVFGGQQRAQVPVISGYSSPSRDILIAQIPPIQAWGKNAFLVPYASAPGVDNIGTDIFRIMAGVDGTEVFINGSRVATLNAGEFYEGSLTSVGVVEANQPILVTQFKKTSKHDGNTVLSDPFMMIIPPKEQFIKECRFINVQAYQKNAETGSYDEVYLQQNISLVVPTSATSTVKLDGVNLAENLFTQISGSEYSYAVINVATGVHYIEADEPFGLYVYGYGYANSYGYVGGMSFQPFDYEPPRISWVDSCFQVVGKVYDDSKTDSKLKDVHLVPESLYNVQVNMTSLEVSADSVLFWATLIDSRYDGKFTISAEDSVGFKTVKDIYVMGNTVSLEGKENEVGIPEIEKRVGINQEVCIPFVIHNYGKFNHNIIEVINFDREKFYIVYEPKELKAGSVDTVYLCIYPQGIGTYVDSIEIATDCGRLFLARVIVRVASGVCDVSEFNYVDFGGNDVYNLVFVGNAQRIWNYLLLTQVKTLLSASVWYYQKVPVRNGFITEFSFRMRNGNNNNTIENSYPGADGIAFVIQNVGLDAIGALGGGIGYSGIHNSLAIEYDLFNNNYEQIENYNDPNGNHIAVQSRGVMQNTTLHSAQSTLAINPDILIMRSDGTVYYSKIDYNVVPRTIRVFLDSVPNFSEPVLVVQNVDLSEMLSLDNGTYAYVGFTSATGSAFQNHDILSWYMCPFGSSGPVNVDNSGVDEEQVVFYVYPNPVDEYVNFQFVIDSYDYVELKLFNVIGEEISSVLSQNMFPQNYSIRWNTGNLESGVYVARLQIGNKFFYRKFVKYFNN